MVYNNLLEEGKKLKLCGFLLVVYELFNVFGYLVLELDRLSL